MNAEAEVNRVERLKKGAVWLLQVEVGGREKLVWMEGDTEGVEELPGETILILDNLEATRVQNRICNGKGLTLGGVVVVAPKEAGAGARLV